MSNEIEEVKKQIDSIVAEILRDISGVDARRYYTDKILDIPKLCQLFGPSALMGKRLIGCSKKHPKPKSDEPSPPNCICCEYMSKCANDIQKPDYCPDPKYQEWLHKSKPRINVLINKGNEHPEERIPLYKPDNEGLLTDEQIREAYGTKGEYGTIERVARAQRDLTRAECRARIEEIFRFFELHQEASEPIPHEVPVFGGKVICTLCRDFRIEETDYQALKASSLQ